MSTLATFRMADRIDALPPYLFAEIDKMKAEVRARGIDIISLGIGDPDLPTPAHIIAALNDEAAKQPNHVYSPYEGIAEYRRAVAGWYKGRAGVELDPESEVLMLIGSKEGIAHFPLAFVNPGDIVLVPDPGYPVYHTSTLFAGGEPFHFPLLEENGYLPDVAWIESQLGERMNRVKAMWFNYPNNPTGATCTVADYDRLIAFARKWGIILCADSAYTEMGFDGYVAPSFLEATGAKDVGVEFHSLSKTYNMTGWRLGWVAGNRDVVNGIGKIKTNVDSGQFMAVQKAGIVALTSSQECVTANMKIWQARRDIIVEGLQKIGFAAKAPQATFYLWMRAPEGYSSREFVKRALSEKGVVCTPGNGFGQYGEGYVRFAFCLSEDRLREALHRLGEIAW